jgi:hypothetical protein
VSSSFLNFDNTDPELVLGYLEVGGGGDGGGIGKMESRFYFEFTVWQKGIGISGS